MVKVSFDVSKVDGVGKLVGGKVLKELANTKMKFLEMRLFNLVLAFDLFNY